jgi:hypothetical protein
LAVKIKGGLKPPIYIKTGIVRPVGGICPALNYIIKQKRNARVLSVESTAGNGYIISRFL